MKRVAAVVMSCLILGVNLPVRAQAPGSGVGAVYLVSIYGMKCDDMANDTTALNNLFATIFMK